MATNEERFRTPEERVKAFREFLHKRCGRGICEKECEVRDLCTRLGYDGKFAGWLTLEAEAEKPDPCPECHGRCEPMKTSVGDFLVRCLSCYYRIGGKPTEAEVIAAHNRFARAARTAKESEDWQ